MGCRWKFDGGGWQGIISPKAVLLRLWHASLISSYLARWTKNTAVAAVFGFAILLGILSVRSSFVVLC